MLIVSKDVKMTEFIRASMPQNKYYRIVTASSAAEARRTLRRTPIDIALINTPLPDEFGTKLAVDLSRECAVAVIVKPELVERAIYKLEPHGVVTLSKLLQRSVVYQTILLLASSVVKLKKLHDDNHELKAKLRELKQLTEAKSLLITKKGLTEEQAHRYIEKTAMDNGMRKSDAVRQIIEELSDEVL